MNKTDAAGLVEQLRALAATWRKHVEAVERLNAAIPPLEATPAERALYGERYKAKDVAEREMRATAMRFAQWCAETDVAESVAAPPLGDVDELCGKDARELLAAEIRADWIASYPAEAVPSETYALKEAANQPAALRAIEKALSDRTALMARVEEACDDLAIRRGDNDETPLTLLNRVLDAAKGALLREGRTNVRAGLLRGERDLLKDELAIANSRVKEAEKALTDIANAVRLGPVTDTTTWQNLARACQQTAAQFLVSKGDGAK